MLLDRSDIVRFDSQIWSWTPRNPSINGALELYKCIDKKGNKSRKNYFIHQLFWKLQFLYSLHARHLKTYGKSSSISQYIRLRIFCILCIHDGVLQQIIVHTIDMRLYLRCSVRGTCRGGYSIKRLNPPRRHPQPSVPHVPKVRLNFQFLFRSGVRAGLSHKQCRKPSISLHSTTTCS